MKLQSAHVHTRRVPVPVFGEAPRTQPHSSYNFGAIFLPSAQRPQTMVRADVDGDFNNNCRFSFDIKPWLVVKASGAVGEHPSPAVAIAMRCPPPPACASRWPPCTPTDANAADERDGRHGQG